MPADIPVFQACVKKVQLAVISRAVRIIRRTPCKNKRILIFPFICGNVIPHKGCAFLCTIRKTADTPNPAVCINKLHIVCCGQGAGGKFVPSVFCHTVQKLALQAYIKQICPAAEQGAVGRCLGHSCFCLKFLRRRRKKLLKIKGAPVFRKADYMVGIVCKRRRVKNNFVCIR